MSLGCGGEGIASPHTEKDLRGPDPRAQSGTRPGTPEVILCLPTTGPLLPQAHGGREQSEDRHEACRLALGSKAKHQRRRRRTLQGQWARGGQGDSESHVLSGPSSLGDFCCLVVSCIVLLLADAVVVSSLYMSISIPDPALCTPQGKSSQLPTRNLSLVLPVFRPPCQSDRRQ